MIESFLLAPAIFSEQKALLVGMFANLREGLGQNGPKEDLKEPVPFQSPITGDRRKYRLSSSHFPSLLPTKADVREFNLRDPCRCPAVHVEPSSPTNYRNPEMDMGSPISIRIPFAHVSSFWKPLPTTPSPHHERSLPEILD